MKPISPLLIGLALALGVSACQASPAPSQAAAPATSPSGGKLAELESVVGYSLAQPAALPAGYVLENASIDQPTHSVCLQYRSPDDTFENILLIAQGPADQAPPLTLVHGWPEYALVKEPIDIGGAGDSLQVAGWRRKAWACTAQAEATTPQFSFALAPRLTWEAGQRRFDLYAANGGCGTPGGLTTLDLLRLAEGLTGKSTHAIDELDPDCLHSAADAGKLAGFDVKEPTYLPENVAFQFATLEKTPDPQVVLRFIHKEHSAAGPFFQISQAAQAEAPSGTTSCNAADDGCEVLHIGDTPVVYHLYPGQDGAADTESLDWYANGVAFSLFRNAGEPGKVYKDELLKIAGSLN